MRELTEPAILARGGGDVLEGITVMPVTETEELLRVSYARYPYRTRTLLRYRT